VTATFVVGLLCFGVGILVDRVVLQNELSTSQPAQSTKGRPRQEISTHGPKSLATQATTRTSTSPGSSNEAAHSTSTLQPMQSTTIGDIQTAILSTSYRWNFGKIFRMVDSLDTNQF
jgi:hypothetical protein